MHKIDYYILGFVEIKVDTADFDKVFTSFLKHGIHSREKDENTIMILYQQYEEAKRALSGVNINFAVSREHRILNVDKNIKRTVTIASALLFTSIIVIFLSSVVWCIEVEGDEAIGDSSVISDLEKCGLYIGRIWSNIDLGEVESRFLNMRSDVGWININRNGTVAYVSIREAGEGTLEKPNNSVYSNIVAAEDCIIEYISVKSGTPAVKVGDAVTKGDLLILGMNTNGKESRFCCAAGEVIGRVNSVVSVVALREKSQKSIDKISVNSLKIKIFNFSINIFKKYGNLDTDCDIIEEKNQISLRSGRKLPLEIIKECRIEYSEEHYQSTDEELVSEASYKMTALVHDKLLGVDLNSIKTYGRFTDEGYEMISELVYSCSVSESVEFFVDKNEE